MEIINWMYLWDPEGMLKLLQLALISAAMACLSQYQDDKSLSEIIDDYEFDRIALFYVVFAIGLVIVFVLFVSFLFNLHKRSGCGSAKGWTSFVMVFSLLWAVLCAVATGMFGDVFNRRVMQNWDISSDEHIQWRYKHALAVVCLGFASFVSFLVDAILHYRITFSAAK